MSSEGVTDVHQGGNWSEFFKTEILQRLFLKVHTGKEKEVKSGPSCSFFSLLINLSANSII